MEGRNDAHILLDDFLDKHRENDKVIKDAQKQMKEDFAQMKAQGFDIKALRQLAKLHLETSAQREKRLETEAHLETYKEATNLE